MRQILPPIALALTLAACAAAPTTQAPQPASAITDPAFYSGTWYEIARTPISLTNGCVAGTTIFYTRPDGQLMERDACHKNNNPAGPEQVFKGWVHINNPDQNTKITTHYTLFGFLPLSQTYWFLKHGPTWFIVSDPTLTHVDILSREPRPSNAQVQDWTARVAALGYDTSKLEFPLRFPPGQYEP